MMKNYLKDWYLCIFCSSFQRCTWGQAIAPLPLHIAPIGPGACSAPVPTLKIKRSAYYKNNSRIRHLVILPGALVELSAIVDERKNARLSAVSSTLRVTILLAFWWYIELFTIIFKFKCSLLSLEPSIFEMITNFREIFKNENT